MTYFCYTIAVAAYNRIFDEAIESYGLVTTLMAGKMRSPPVVFDVAVAKSFKVAGKRMFLRGLRNRVNSAFKGSRNRDIICAESQ